MRQRANTRDSRPVAALRQWMCKPVLIFFKIAGAEIFPSTNCRGEGPRIQQYSVKIEKNNIFQGEMF
jgi:hypothetical protein